MAPGGMDRCIVLSRIRGPTVCHPGWRRGRLDIPVGMATRRNVGRPARCGLWSFGAWRDPAVVPSARYRPDVYPIPLAVGYLRPARFDGVPKRTWKPVVPD